MPESHFPSGEVQRKIGATITLISALALGACSSDNSHNVSDTPVSTLDTPRPHNFSEAIPDISPDLSARGRVEFKRKIGKKLALLESVKERVVFLAELSCKPSSAKPWEPAVLSKLYEHYYSVEIDLPNEYEIELYSSPEGGMLGTQRNICPPSTFYSSAG